MSDFSCLIGLPLMPHLRPIVWTFLYSVVWLIFLTILASVECACRCSLYKVQLWNSWEGTLPGDKMFRFSLFCFASGLFRLILLAVITVLRNRFVSSRNKNSPFECGFDPKDSARLPFSIRFFLLAVVFLIFDIEVAFLFPLILSIKIIILSSAYMAGYVFLVILLVGLLHEWNQGSLSWVV